MLPITKIKTTVLLASALLLSALPLTAATRSRSSSTHGKMHSTAHVTHHSASHHAHAISVSSHRGRVHGTKARVVRVALPRYRGQQSIEPSRTMEIQQALIREHYLDGEATGEWDQATRDALTRYQGDNHWQTKILPDSRALIKLGLGPSQQNLLNPESAATAEPYQFEHSAPSGTNY